MIEIIEKVICDRCYASAYLEDKIKTVPRKLPAGWIFTREKHYCNLCSVGRKVV